MHGNGEALRTVLRKVRRKRFDATLMLGDLVGYGAEPNQVVEAMRDMPGHLYAIRGNHDKVIAGLEDGETFNDAALQAARWTTRKLSARNLATVRDLPIGPLEINDRLSICHGSPLDEDQYLFSEFDAYNVFETHTVPVTFFGHTHLPSVFILHSAGVKGILLGGSKGRIRIQPGFRYLINPGSIGQPRDRNPMAAYMIYDTDKSIVTWYRIPYRIDRAKKKILAAGLPEPLAERLSFGV
jgi:predicted phosphodiesterase